MRIVSYFTLPILLVLSILTFSLLYFGPVLDRNFPVVTNTEIHKIKEISNKEVEIWVTFDKRRNCEFLGLSWYIGDPNDGFSKTWLIFLDDGKDSEPTRPAGKQIAGPWLIGISRDNLFLKSFALATHQCNPLWKTRTIFYQSKDRAKIDKKTSRMIGRKLVRSH